MARMAVIESEICDICSYKVDAPAPIVSVLQLCRCSENIVLFLKMMEADVDLNQATQLNLSVPFNIMELVELGRRLLAKDRSCAFNCLNW